MSTYQDTIRDLFVTGLRNQHAVEKQALAIMTPQVARIEHYPEVADRLRLHISETNTQIARLDEILATFDASGSPLKDLGLGLSGSLAALAHTVAGDEILKNNMANYAFEHFEIAGYKSLLVLATEGNFSQAAPLLQMSLGEEVAMAEWIEQHTPLVVRRYATLHAEGGPGAAKV